MNDQEKPRNSPGNPTPLQANPELIRGVKSLGLKGFTGWALCEICLEGSTTVVLGLGFRELGFRGLGFRARGLVS